MRPAVVYVLADGAAGLYSRMAVMSVYSLQRYHPDIPVWLVMDPETFGRLERLGSALIDMATPVVEKVPVQFDVTERSRYLKTRMRSIVQGDFLYIDTDTIICAPLDGIDRVDADLAAVADANSPLGLCVAQDRVLPTFREVWQMSCTFLLMSIGVVLIRAASFQDALYCYRAMMHLRLQDFPALLSWTYVSTSFWIVVMLVVEWVNRREDYGLPMKRVHAKAVRYAVYLLLIAIIVLYFDSGTPRFIYFQF